jgi:hypothetical protein
MIKTSSVADFNRLKKTIKDLPTGMKIDVLTMLEDELFAGRFKSLLMGLRGAAKKRPITIEEITKEVEAVRQKRYESRN